MIRETHIFPTEGEAKAYAENFLHYTRIARDGRAGVYQNADGTWTVTTEHRETCN